MHLQLQRALRRSAFFKRNINSYILETILLFLKLLSGVSKFWKIRRKSRQERKIQIKSVICFEKKKKKITHAKKNTY